MDQAIQRLTTSGIAAAGKESPRARSQSMSRLQDGPLGTLRFGGISLGSNPSVENHLVPVSVSTAITSRMSSRSPSALLSSRYPDARVNSAWPISERTSANRPERLQEP